MADNEAIWNEVITRLGTITEVKKVYEGVVDFATVPNELQPCIMVEPDLEEPIEDHFDNPSANYCFQEFTLVILVMFTVWEKQKGVTGKTGIKGALEWAKAVKDKLTETPYHLNGLVRRVSFGRTIYMRNIPGLDRRKHVTRFVQIEARLMTFYSTTER